MFASPANGWWIEDYLFDNPDLFNTESLMFAEANGAEII